MHNRSLYGSQREGYAVIGDGTTSVKPRERASLRATTCPLKISLVYNIVFSFRLCDLGIFSGGGVLVDPLLP